MFFGSTSWEDLGDFGGMMRVTWEDLGALREDSGNMGGNNSWGGGGFVQEKTEGVVHGMVSNISMNGGCEEQGYEG